MPFWRSESLISKTLSGFLKKCHDSSNDRNDPELEYSDPTLASPHKTKELFFPAEGEVRRG